MRLRITSTFGMMALAFASPGQSTQEDNNDFWQSRDVAIAADASAAAIRIGIWDSGVDLALFDGRVARDKGARPIVRGYDAYKQRQDTPLEVLPAKLLGRQTDLNLALTAFDDIDGDVASPAAKAMNARLAEMSKEERAAFLEDIDRWSGYAHGTGVADIATSGLPRAQLVVARMEWWHGSPPVPCWTRALADREARSIRDLLTFLVKSGARVVNMSWGRLERSYISNLEQCAPDMSKSERQALVFGVRVSGFDFQSFIVSHLAGPQWLTGGAFGPEAAIPTMIISVLAGAAAVVVAHREGRFMRPLWLRNSDHGIQHPGGTT